VLYRKSAGFERYDFVHNALPEVNPSEVDLSAELFGRTFSFPLFISSMTGGYTEAGAVNAIIAGVCEKMNLPFGVGSQRAMLEDSSQIESFSVVRDHAPSAFIAANIGGAQLIGGLEKAKTDLLVNSIKADAIIVHLNPLQELMQPEGDQDFRGIEEGIAQLVSHTEIPVIVKETGAGISASVARRLLSIGVECIDVAGAGGTSWAKVENLREQNTNPQHAFDDWGIPTVDCLREIHQLRDEFTFYMIASGGIRSAFDLAKSIALGADFAATAQPVIKAIMEDGEEACSALVNGWMHEAKMILALLGCISFDKINQSHIRPVLQHSLIK
jgi:isopentenyl-diphosphate Delta-isomerase